MSLEIDIIDMNSLNGKPMISWCESILYGLDHERGS
jgi:hypothetical protein